MTSALLVGHRNCHHLLVSLDAAIPSLNGLLHRALQDLRDRGESTSPFWFGGHSLSTRVSILIIKKMLPSLGTSSERFAQASRVYADNPGALHLRGMNMLYEAIREKGAMVIVPSSAIETMGLRGTLATASIAKEQ
jgi:hypothetical protein